MQPWCLPLLVYRISLSSILLIFCRGRPTPDWYSENEDFSRLWRRGPRDARIRLTSEQTVWFDWPDALTRHTHCRIVHSGKPIYRGWLKLTHRSALQGMHLIPLLTGAPDSLRVVLVACVLARLTCVGHRENDLWKLGHCNPYSSQKIVTFGPAVLLGRNKTKINFASESEHPCDPLESVGVLV